MLGTASTTCLRRGGESMPPYHCSMQPNSSKARGKAVISRRSFATAAAALALGGRKLLAEESTSALAPEIEAMRYFTTKTSGGKQFWADVWIFHDYRIQRHAITRHCRLLDGQDR